MGTYNGYYKISSTDLLDIVMPVGTVFLSVSDSFNPQTAWGGEWSKISSGYCLWTTTINNGDATGTIGPGLPDFSGQLNAANNTAYAESCSGAFSGANTTGDHHKSRGYNGERYMVFDASSYNSIYGNSSTVQPPAYRVYAWRRTN